MDLTLDEIAIESYHPTDADSAAYSAAPDAGGESPGVWPKDGPAATAPASATPSPPQEVRTCR
ncbi:hypothetical protein [Sphaerisporangium dianthi]|uniref:Uncharacterized protein n=1 Tax=Sphaerisporangium dianthi TaxID=1436120 RepID=A0ABV9CVI0_9ACTN